MIVPLDVSTMEPAGNGCAKVNGKHIEASSTNTNLCVMMMARTFLRLLRQTVELVIFEDHVVP